MKGEANALANSSQGVLAKAKAEEDMNKYRIWIYLVCVVLAIPTAVVLTETLRAAWQAHLFIFLACLGAYYLLGKVVSRYFHKL